MLRRLFGDDVAEHDLHLSDYFIERSLMRPREVLQFCRLTAEKADQRNHEKVTMDDIHDAEIEYSRWKVEDVGNEFMFKYPGMSDSIFKRFFGGKLRYAEAELREFLEEALTDPATSGKHIWMDALRNVDDLIQILYDIGFLKACSQNREWQSAQHPDFSLALADEYVVHPVFRRHLHLES